MDKEFVIRQVETLTYDNLLEWRNHVIQCLKYYQKVNDNFEIDECMFVLGLIDARLATLD